MKELIKLEPDEVREVFCNCDLCGGEIFVGDTFYDLDEKVICKECVFWGERVAE